MMMVPAVLAGWCVAMAALSLQLSPVAGRLPGVVAMLTLTPILLQMHRDWVAGGSTGADDRRAAEAKAIVSLLALLGLLYLAGFLIALPLYGAWQCRRRPVWALGAAAATAAALSVVDRYAGLFRGVLWP